jgi:outer membrane protein assembly factor BamA
MHAFAAAWAALAVAATGPGSTPPGGDAGAAPAPRFAEVGSVPSEDLPAPRAYTVERLAFRGLEAVREWAVRRHLTVREGEILEDQMVLVSRLRLLQLGWFSTVETRVEKGSARGLVVLVFEVRERNTLLVTDLVLGSTRPQPLYGGLGLSQQNFLGQGLALGGAFVYGGAPAGRPTDPDRFAARAAFDAPDAGLGGVHLVAGASGLWLRGEELSCPDAACSGTGGHYGAAPRLRYQRAGGEVRLGIRPGPFERLTGAWRLERISGTFDAGDGGPAGPIPPLELGRSLLSALSWTWEFDDRDDLFLPTEGLLAVAQVALSSRALGSDYEYSRYALQLESGFGLLGRPLRLQGFLGLAQGAAPFFERFYPADLSYFAVGPALGRALELNFSTDSRTAALAAMCGAEYAIPLWSRGGFFQRGYLALGARTVWSSATLGGRRIPFSRWPLSLDAALRLDTPIGTFNASLAALLDNFL